MIKLVLSLVLMLFLVSCGSISAPSVTGNETASPPTELAVAKTTSTSVVLTWSAASGDVYAYKIYRDGTEVGTTIKAGPASAAPTVFSDNNLNPATTYVYSVAASSTFGKETASPNTVIATTLPAGPLDPPTRVTVTQTTVDSVSLNWEASNYTVPGAVLTYSIYRNGTLIGTTTAAAGQGGSFTDTKLSPATTYYYSVSVSTESTLSAPVSATTASTSISLTSTVITFAGSPLHQGSADGLGGWATFYQPYGMVRLGGYIYLADSGNHTIRRIDLATSQVSTVAGTPGVLGAADGIGAAARFDTPRGITTDGTNLYVTDSGNNAIRKFDPVSGAVTTFAGTLGSRGFLDGIGTVARFYAPRGIASDGSSLYVADTYNNVIRKISIADASVSTIAGTKIKGSNDGVGPGASFFYPYGITCDGPNLYVTDTCNHTIRKIVIASMQVTTLAGRPGFSGSADGPGGDAGFYYPDGILSDGTSLYVCDTSNYTIRKVNIATANVVTLAGKAGASGTTDGSGSLPRFRAPRGIALYGDQLFITDFVSHTVRRITLQ
ncbi:fibronectin type III domain-containing protein [Geomonas edaphica]|uniref:fibronectin type III domain-containing protein n=1 Tax=Geomonas edaphica TaxID=2570226 RepID=UPI0013A5C882|nr:fibronectin type III domain-containing protein [Geomonas edaphica]